MKATRRTALVFASTSGLGKASALELARQGLAVVVTSRNQDAVDRTLAELHEGGAQCSGLVADVGNVQDIERVFAHVDAVHGRLDVLVCNSGGPRPGSITDLTDDEWFEDFSGTFMSAIRALRLAIPRMALRQSGRVIIIGSSSVRQPIPNLLASNAFRPALVGVIKSMAAEYAGVGITFNVVSPGRIATPRVQKLDELAAKKSGRTIEDVREESHTRIPMKRYGSPDEFAAAVAFLASESASYITAQTLLVDGGLVTALP